MGGLLYGMASEITEVYLLAIKIMNVERFGLTLLFHSREDSNKPNISALKLMTSQIPSSFSCYCWLLISPNISPLGVATEAQGKLHELEFLQQIRNQSPHHPGHAHVIHLRDHFYHSGPHGRHLCLVTEPLFQNMSYLLPQLPHRAIPPRLLRSLARQIVLAVQYLHDECNIVHTGE